MGQGNMSNTPFRAVETRGITLTSPGGLQYANAEESSYHHSGHQALLPLRSVLQIHGQCPHINGRGKFLGGLLALRAIPGSVRNLSFQTKIYYFLCGGLSRKSTIRVVFFGGQHFDLSSRNGCLTLHGVTVCNIPNTWSNYKLTSIQHAEGPYVHHVEMYIYPMPGLGFFMFVVWKVI